MSNEDKAKRMRQAKVIRELYQCDHLFIGEEGVKRFTEPFGFVGTTYLAYSDPPDTIKGLTLHDGKGNPIDKCRGQDADKIAEEICQHIGASYPPMWGRGSRLRVCCAAILEKLNAKTPEGV